tara:strand:+ start:72001 stop:72231 length:231 start_codon:yes stop_codon:yes gene_type:complete
VYQLEHLSVHLAGKILGKISIGDTPLRVIWRKCAAPRMALPKPYRDVLAGVFRKITCNGQPMLACPNIFKSGLLKA